MNAYESEILCSDCQMPLVIPPPARPVPEWLAKMKPPKMLCETCKEKRVRQEAEQARLNSVTLWTAADIAANPAVALRLVGVPEKHQDACLSRCTDLPYTLVSDLREYASNLRGFLFACGPAGAGKTYSAVGILKEAVTSGKVKLADARFITEADYKRELRAAYDSGKGGDIPSRLLPARHARHIPFLILDDIGATRETAWGQEQITDLVCERHATGLATVITSNLDLAEIARFIDPRAASRIGESRKIIVFPAKDLRLVVSHGAAK